MYHGYSQCGCNVDTTAYGYGAIPVTPPMPGCATTAPFVSPVGYGPGRGAGFALIVVLFILLIIIGASWCPKPVK